VTLVAVGRGRAEFLDLRTGSRNRETRSATECLTRALSPRNAVAMEAILNFVGAFRSSFKVAATVARLVHSDAIR